MKREDAIRNIKRFRDGLDPLSELMLIQSLDIAIEALSEKDDFFIVHNVHANDSDYPLAMLAVSGKENYDLISIDGVICVPLFQVIDKLMSVTPDVIVRNGVKYCPNCGAEMRKTVDANPAIELVRCKDCKWLDKRNKTDCHNPRYGDGWANYPPPYVDDDYFCKDGELEKSVD